MGQLFSMANPAQTLSHLDEFEEVDEGLFRRELVSVWTGKDEKKAWAYFYARPLRRAHLLPGGKYPTARDSTRQVAKRQARMK